MKYAFIGDIPSYVPMIKRRLLLIVFSISLGSMRVSSQESKSCTGKPPLDIGSLADWPTLGNAHISENGKYAFYTVENFTSGTARLIVKSIDLKWQKSIEGISSYTAVFTPDSKKVIFKKPGDSLCMLQLGTEFIAYKTGILSFQIPPGKGEWMACRYQNPGNNLILHNLLTGKERELEGGADYIFTKDGIDLLYQVKENEMEKEEFSLHWLNPSSGIDKIVRKGRRAGDFVFSKDGKMLAFLESGGKSNTVWVYNLKTGQELLDSNYRSDQIDIGLCIKSILGFSNDGRRLIISLKEAELSTVKSYPVKVDVWSYRDSYLQSQQLANQQAPNYIAIINLRDGHLFRLQQENDLLRSDFPSQHQGSDEWVLMMNYNGEISEAVWNPLSRPSIYLVNTLNGQRCLIKEGDPKLDVLSYELSPTGKYLIYFDATHQSYFSYEISTGIRRNITSGIATDWTMVSSEIPRSEERTVPSAGWIKDKEQVLLYDEHDVWMVDLTAKMPPRCITNGYGRKHNIKFWLGADYSSDPMTLSEKIILIAFNRDTKDNGFFEKKLNDSGDPEELTMGPHLIFAPEIGSVFTFKPVKSTKADVYIVRKESATEFPNYYVTEDFKKFLPISDFHPERKYNWLTTELITWNASDGNRLQGVLYKPENFDPQKKYPVIFHYYEKLSSQLNMYHFPRLCDGEMNIPYFVSNGYLVLTPDIHYRIGEPGESALNSVISAARHLAEYPWVDKFRMGLQGHSFGGYETNYIITRTDLFAAACSAAGASDLIGMFGGVIDGPGASNNSYYELDQGRMGGSLWSSPDLYIKNSPVFGAEKVTTPLLMMNNKADGAVPFSQGVEFFTALRRFHKKVWMLQYDEGGHQVAGSEAVDFTKRMIQFFDHYLKKAPAPEWMEKGVPANLKGKRSGLALDGNAPDY